MAPAPLCVLVLLLQVPAHPYTPPERPPILTPSPPPTPADLGLPVQYDLDLPVEVATYDPTKRPPPPIKDDDGDDPKDEPPPVFYGEEIESENDTICYVIDISGSMRRFERLVRAKAELRKSILALAPNVRFNVVAYSCSMQVWSPKLKTATPDSKASALSWVEALTASGGTGTGPAVAVGLADRECLAVALLTDGVPNCGANTVEAHRTMIKSNNRQSATVNVFGVDASGIYRQFCQNVARDSGGSYYDVP